MNPPRPDFSPETAPQTVLAWAFERFHPRLAVASSFSVEDAVLIDIAVRVHPGARVFAIDTGRLNEETYDVAERIRVRYGLHIEWVFPRRKEVERLEREKGLYSFRSSPENRRECCSIRKVEPLHRALDGLEGWVTGMRREQGITRTSVDFVETDEAHGGIAKINPLAYWSLADVQAYAAQNAVPTNRLYARGYPSIGCAPCTRAVEPGEDPRAGRWWWEPAEHKECGLHDRGGERPTGTKEQTR